jgi:hypothetical protein
MLAIRNDPENATIAYEIMKRLRSETWHHTMRAAAFGAAGLGLLMICGAVALVIWANGTAIAGKWLAVAGTSFGGAISEALSNAKVNVDGTVKVVPGGEVEIAKGGTVTVSGGNVGIEQTAPLRVEVTANIPRPTEAQLAPDARPTSNAKSVTDYVVFKHISYGKGQVVTGWRYQGSQEEQPSEQYCYYSQQLGSSAEAVVWLGYDGQFKAPQSPPQNLDVKAAYSNCMWR